MELVCARNPMRISAESVFLSGSSYVSSSSFSSSSYLRLNLVRGIALPGVRLRRSPCYDPRRRYVSVCQSGSVRSSENDSEGRNHFHSLSERKERARELLRKRGERELPLPEGSTMKASRSGWASILSGGIIALGLGLGLSLLCKPALSKSSVATPLTVSVALDDKGEVQVENTESVVKTSDDPSPAVAVEGVEVPAEGGEALKQATESLPVVEDVQEEKAEPPHGEGSDLTTDSAEILLRGFLDRHPNDKKALEALLFIRLKKGQVDASLSVLEKLMELEPDNIEWMFIRAQTYDFAGKLDQAREAFEEILQSRPLSARALQGLSTVMHKAGEEEEALQLLKNAVELAVNSGQSHEALNLRMLLGQMHTIQGNLEQAMELYKIVVEEDPKDYRPYLCQGLVYSIIGKEEEAEKQFKNYRKFCPKDFAHRGFFDELMLKAKTEARKLKRNVKKEEMLKKKGRKIPKMMQQPLATPLAASGKSSPIPEDGSPQGS